MGLDEHDAADVLQTVFERLHKHLPAMRDPSRLRAWVVTTAKREGLLQRQRRHRTQPMGLDDGEAGLPEWDLADEAPLPEQQLSQLQQLHRLRQALDQLEPRSRSMIDLLFGDEDERLPYEAMARRLGMPVGSLGPTRQRCLDRLRRLLTQAGDYCSTTGTSAAGGVLRLRPQRTRPSIITMPTPGMSPS